MNNLKTHDAVFEAVCRDVFWAVDVVTWWTGDWGVEVIVKEAVVNAVRGTVRGTVRDAVFWAVDRAVSGDPSHSGLQDFLREVTA